MEENNRKLNERLQRLEDSGNYKGIERHFWYDFQLLTYAKESVCSQ